MIYLLLTADSFRESALAEMRRVGRVRIVSERHGLMIVDIRSGDAAARLRRARFVYSCFPLLRAYGIDRRRYLQSILQSIKSLRLSKKGRIRLECLDVNCKAGYSAKDIEVYVGSRLEKDGYSIDLRNPEVLAYCVLMDSKCYSGFVRMNGQRHSFIDPFRQNGAKKVSRAEFKIMEAFREFGLDAPRTAIDLGAAPGGWSLFLARLGAGVIAIDAAALDYPAIRENGVSVRVVRKLEGESIRMDSVRTKTIVHIRHGLEEARQCMSGTAGMLVDDMNIGGIKSAEAVASYSPMLRRGGVLVMTVKCMHRSVDQYVREVERALGRRFSVIGIVVLPHNRQEITLVAKKRGVLSHRD